MEHISMANLCCASVLLLLLLLLPDARQAGVAEVVQDNIALPQEHAHRFILPAPGLRHRPRHRPRPPSPQQVAEDPPLTNDLHGDVVGQLLPLGPGPGVSRVVGLDVACGTDQMTISLAFDNDFAGIVYAKGFYAAPECVYVSPGSVGVREVQFVVGAGKCGAQFVEPPDSPPYLENVIVIQNQPGIQEVWDSARGVRCVFEGGLGARAGPGSQRVSAALNVDLVDQRIVTFAAHTAASASLDVQIGRGPFAKSASGMVKIGEMMTMVVGVEGPSNTDVLVRECLARDGARRNTYQLTDKNGCVMGSRRQVMGSWQKTRDTGTNDVPVLAFSHFQAFKFPDENDVFLECEVDLCVEACPACPEDQNLQTTKRKRRDTSYLKGDEEEEEEEEEEERRRNSLEEGAAGGGGRRNASSVAEGVKLARRLRVISPEDFSIIRDTPITLVTKGAGGGGDEGDICLGVWSFAAALVVVVLVLVASSALTAALCIRVRTIPSTASTYPPDSSFHAFSTVSGKTR